MFDWLKFAVRRWLGIGRMIDSAVAIGSEVRTCRGKIEVMRQQIVIQNLLLARIVAKVDPQYATDPHSAETKEASDAIARTVIDRIKGESAATAHNYPIDLLYL